MDMIRADHAAIDRDMRAGNTVGIVEGRQYADMLARQDRAIRTDPVGSGLSLSRIGLALASLDQGRGADPEVVASTFSDFVASIDGQIRAEHGRASVFRETPRDGSSDRLTLSKQASNCLSMVYYGGAKIHPDLSAKNPFESLDRMTLSQIAFDDSGTFTSVERHLASMVIGERDTTFRSGVYELASSLNEGRRGPWHEALSYLGDAQISAGMSDAERAWRGWGGTESLLSYGRSLATEHSLDIPALPPYGRLSGEGPSALVVRADEQGAAEWSGMAIRQLTGRSHDERLALVKILDIAVDRADQ